MKLGEPITGILHSADAHAGVQVPIYQNGSETAYTLLASDFIEIHSIRIQTAAGGDTFLTVDSAYNATPTAGTTVLRGTTPANGDLLLEKMTFEGISGGLPWITSPAGVIDVQFYGTLRHTTQVGRPSWREHYQQPNVTANNTVPVVPPNNISPN